MSVGQASAQFVIGEGSLAWPFAGPMGSSPKDGRVPEGGLGLKTCLFRVNNAVMKSSNPSISGQTHTKQFLSGSAPTGEQEVNASLRGRYGRVQLPDQQ